MNPATNDETPRSRLSALLARYGDIFWWLHSLCELLVERAAMPTGDITLPVPF